jgi:hypothetical protein
MSNPGDILPRTLRAKKKIVVLDCRGPPESDMNLQSFQVNQCGCVGGRNLTPKDNREILQFRDYIVSRRHFEITQTTDTTTGESTFYIRDMGSQGGTFVRLPHGERKQLLPGMTVLLGQHELTVSLLNGMASSQGPAAVHPADLVKQFSADNNVASSSEGVLEQRY